MDINAVKEILLSGDHTCVLSCGDFTVTSKERGILPLIRLINSGKNFRCGCAADKVVGKAAALLYAYMGVCELYASVISERAVAVCGQNGITVNFDSVVPFIVNRRGDGKCPMEQAVWDIDDPPAAYAVLSERVGA